MSRFLKVRNLSVVPKKFTPEALNGGPPYLGIPFSSTAPTPGPTSKPILPTSPDSADGEPDRTANPFPDNLPALALTAPRGPLPGTPHWGVPPPGKSHLESGYVEGFISKTDKGIPATGIPLSVISAPVPFISTPKIRQATLAQDGHSLGEQALYESLWDRAQPLDKESRIISIGYRQMSDIARMTVNNCKANIFSLMQKLAIEEAVSFTHSQGRTYRVMSYSAILQRRKAAGLTHYVKSRGVTFIDPAHGTPITMRSRGTARPPKKGTPPRGGPIRGLPERGELGVPLSGQSGTPQPGLLPYREEDRNSFSNSTTALQEIVQSKMPDFDNAAVQQLWSDCLRQVPDVKVQEVGLLFERKLPDSLTRSVTNPVGFLVRAVARSCTPAAIRALRQGRELPKDTPVTFEIDELTGMLNDPNTPTHLREFIEHRLRESKK
jgi:hypothetical protein